MNDDVKKFIYGTLIVFLVGVTAWVSFIYFNACDGPKPTCVQGDTKAERTSIPTLPPATLPAMDKGSGEVVVSDQCRVAAVDLIGAWVDAGAPETDAFEFTDVNGIPCESTFAEVQPLFMEGNLFYSGSLSCVSCHSSDVTVSSAQLDLGSYAGITAGSRRVDAESKGTDILSGSWASSILFDFMTNAKSDIPGHEGGSSPVVFAGKPLPQPTETPEPTAAPEATATAAQ